MTQIAYFDVETNRGQDWLNLSDFTTIHCIAVAVDGGDVVGYGPDRLQEAVSVLSGADVVVGHNILRFDLPILNKTHGFAPNKFTDTLLLSRLIYPEIGADDVRRPSLPKKMCGSHSLKAWGHRIGILKDEFGEDCGFDVFSPEMLEYCRQDVSVTRALFKYLNKDKPSERSVALEHDFAAVMLRQERNGFVFDASAAKKLMTVFTARQLEVAEALKSSFPPRVVQLKTKQKLIPFNPASRLHISDALIAKYGWKPTEFTDGGRPKVDESVLKGLSYPEAVLLTEYLLLDKRLGQLANGDNAWIKLERGGRIHGRVNTNGTVTGRCSHSTPNMAQCPRVGSPYGTECRSLFLPSPGNVLVGVDASGLELRCLAHYAAAFDGGQYAKIVCDGDVHTENQKATGLATRNEAKTFIYALIYGAGNDKIGSIVGGGPSRGSTIKRAFYKRFPALLRLKTQIDNTLVGRTYLVGLDGRRLPIRSKHLSLNTLLQSAGAVLVKTATVLADSEFRRRGLEVRQVAHIHDEIQYDCKQEIADEVGRIAVEAIKRSGESFSFRCALTGEFRVGGTWAETH